MKLQCVLPVLAAALAIAAPTTAEEGRHPLDPLTPIEVRTFLRTLGEAGHWDEESRLALIHVDEPAKPVVDRWRPGATTPRRALAVIKQADRTFEAVVDVTKGAIVSWTARPGVQPNFLLTDEWEVTQEIVRAHEGWGRAVRERGIDELEGVVIVPLTAGYFGAPAEASERLIKALSFDSRGASNFWAHPLEGLVVVISLDRGRVIELIDQRAAPVPKTAAELSSNLPASAEPPADRSEIDVDGQLVRWGPWSFHWRMDPRLGMVLSLVRFGADEEARSVLYQASLSEMYVPYTDPSAGWYFRAYMDAGEYGLGKLSSKLVPGLDCPPGARFLNPWFVDEWGNPYVRERAACLFTRSTGEVAWRHYEAQTDTTAGRGQSELVVRTVPAIGNYDYLLDWIFRPDGSIRVEVGATGVVQVKGTRARGPSGEGAESEGRYGHWVAEHAAAIHHDHYFSFRLDFDVAGRANSLSIDRLRPVDIADGPRSSSWIVEGEIAKTEGAGRLTIDLERPALWRVINSEARNRNGYPASYQVVPGANALPLFAVDDVVLRRAGFAQHHLWTTPFERGERFAAGSYPNQSRGGDGLPRWTRRNRPIQDTDIVLWYTLGMHHVVRSEDWPVMPTTRSGFELRPFDFFDHNPAVD